MSLIRRQHLSVLLLIALAGPLCYSNILNAPFQFDDRFSILENEFIHLDELTWQGLADAAFRKSGHRPVTNLTLALNYYLGGLEVWGYHLFNVAVHVAAGMLLYGWIYRTLRLPFFQARYSPASAHRIAALASLLWVVHPVQTQAVTYIVQRATGLAALFYLGSLFAYLLGRTGPSRYRLRWYGTALLSGLLALGSKEIAVTLPVILILYDALLICGLERERVRKRLPFYGVLTVVPAVLGGLMFSRLGIDLFTGHYHQQAFTVVERLWTEGRVLMHYLSLLVFPHPSRLSVDYYFPVSRSLMDPLSTFFSWAVIVGLLGLAYGLRRRAALVSFCILWFFVNLALESTVILLDLVFEHRLYTPSISVFLLAAVGAESLWAGVLERRVWLGRAALAGLLGVLVVFGSWTWERNRVWTDRLSLWQDAVSKHPLKPRTHFNLAGAYLSRGQVSNAMVEYKVAASLRPEYEPLAVLELQKKIERLEAAGKDLPARVLLLQMVELFPDEPTARYLLGSFLMDHGDLPGAVRHLEMSVRLDPADGFSYNNLGLAYLTMERFDAALKSLGKALELDLSFADSYEKLGVLIYREKKYPVAIEIYQLLLQADPLRTSTLFNLGLAYSANGEVERATVVLEKATRLSPRFSEAYNNLGVNYGKAGRLEEALEVLKEALRLNPRYAEAHHNLARVYELQGLEALSEEHDQRSRQISR